MIEQEIEQSLIDKLDDLKYSYRQEKERYSRRVLLEEIEANDYNLNISRYISTAVPEESVDLPDVHKELVALEQDIKEARNKHNAFLEELGLPLLL
nr:N-6 DNA methylase [Candidatus Electrothrix aestuarii]